MWKTASPDGHHHQHSPDPKKTVGQRLALAAREWYSDAKLEEISKKMADTRQEMSWVIQSLKGAVN